MLFRVLWKSYLFYMKATKSEEDIQKRGNRIAFIVGLVVITIIVVLYFVIS